MSPQSGETGNKKNHHEYRIMKEIIGLYGAIDVLVNNAGITQRSAFVDMRISVYRRVMEVNFIPYAL